MMEFDLVKIDPYNCTIEELEKEIERVKKIKDEYYGTEQSIKVFINSIYGACASPYFVGYNINVAEAVTLQGQDLIKYANSIIDDYFLNKWHLDKELHKQLGLSYVNKINDKTVIVYNDTDSIINSSLITYKNNDEIYTRTIEQLYKDNIKNGSAGITLNGHESVKTDYKVLNWKEDKKIYFEKVKRIIRHNVTKSKWKLKTKTGKEIIITNDHSLIVFRDNKQVIAKPKDIKNDKILCVNSKEEIEYYFDDVDFCKEIGTFEDEYVYDIEMEDETHTFIANDILVHNSTYVTFAPVIKSCDAPTERKDIIDFILKIKKLKLSDYLKENFNLYAKERNTEDMQDLELEKISSSALMIAKKKYILDLAWKDPGIYFDPQQKITPTGVEIVQGSTPKFARKVLKELINLIFKNGKSLAYSEIIKILRNYKKEFLLQDPDNLSKTVSIGDYEKYVLEDKTDVILADKCPINVRAAAIYNNLVLNNKWKSKYNLIKTGDKIKHYYCKGDTDVFGFLPGDYPYEFAPSVNYDVQFAKIIIEPFNRFIEPLGFNHISENLIYARSLF